MANSLRKSAIQRAKEYLAVRPVFLDTETTGLDIRAEIIEIGVLDHDGNVLLNTLVRPTRSIPFEAQRIHGISDAMVQGAPGWPEVWPLVKAVISGRYVGIYNADFDIRMMKQSHQQYMMDWDISSQRVFDVMKLYGDYLGSQKWVSLDSAGRQCGIRLPNSHRALDDTKLLRALLQHIASRLP